MPWSTFHIRNGKKCLHSGNNAPRRSLVWACGLLLILIAGGAIVAGNEAQACDDSARMNRERASLEREIAALERTQPELQSQMRGAPEIVRSGVISTHQQNRAHNSGPTGLWLQIAKSPAAARAVLLEPVWGSGPDSLSEMWGSAIPIVDGRVEVLPSLIGPQRGQPFTVALRARFVMRDGSLSAPSLPVLVTHAGNAKHRDGASAESVVMVLCCFILLGLWFAYRRSSEPLVRIRIAAATALISLFFLSVTPALSWYTVDDPTGRLVAVDCHLGDEAQCATYAPDAGPNPMSTSDVSAERRFEIGNWMGASSAFRLGLVWSLILLLPALIWLMVVPTLRPAQTAVAFGASGAGYTFLSAVLFRLCTPSWMSVEATPAFDLTLLTSGTIVVTIGLVVRLCLRLQQGTRSEIPTAVARRM